MDKDYLLGALVVVVIFSSIMYAVKRNFDENELYIREGYHRVAGTNVEVWAK